MCGVAPSSSAACQAHRGFQRKPRASAIMSASPPATIFSACPASVIRPIAIGLITEAGQAEKIVAGGEADMIALARGFLWNPRWAWHAALELGATPHIPDQYLRGRPPGRAAVFGEPRRSRA